MKRFIGCLIILILQCSLFLLSAQDIRICTEKADVYSKDSIQYPNYKKIPDCGEFGDIANSISGSLSPWQEVELIEIQGDWALVKYGDFEFFKGKNAVGWVKCFHLRYQNEKDIEHSKKENKFWWITSLIVICLVIFLIFLGRFHNRCFNCNKWNAMKYEREKLINSVDTSIRKSENHTDVYGKSHTNHYHVPATRYEYEVYKKCKYCGHISTSYYSSTREN